MTIRTLEDFRIDSADVKRQKKEETPLFFSIPIELQFYCLQFCELKDLCSFSLVSKQCQKLVSDPAFFRIIRKSLGLPEKLTFSREECFFGMQMGAKLIHMLQNNLEKEIWEAIDRMPILKTSIKLKEDLSIMQIINGTKFEDNKLLYKKIIKNDLYLIFMDWSTEIFQIHSNFQNNFSSDENKFYTSYIKTSCVQTFFKFESEEDRIQKLKHFWLVLSKELSAAFGLSKYLE